MFGNARLVGLGSILTPYMLFNNSCIAFQFKLVTTVDELKSYIDRSQLTPEFGGVFHYDHDEWIRFRIVSMTIEYFALVASILFKRLS